MKPTAVIDVLLAVAGRAKQAQLYWQAGLAAARARGDGRAPTEAFAHHVEAEMCLLAAIRAAGPPAGHRIDGLTLSRDPVKAMIALRDHAHGHGTDDAIEAAHEPARRGYRDAFAAPLSAAEQDLAQTLAGLPDARRDKVIEQAESLAR
jgi:hypothetical protein